MAFVRDLAALLRCRQWTKNAVVFAPFLFYLGEVAPRHVLSAGDIWRMALQSLAATLLFSLVSSGIYIINDVRDAPQDRRHPLKRYRPIAAGRFSPAFALALAAVLLIASLAAAWRLAPPFAGVAAAYVVMQLVYTFRLKAIALLDVFIIATGFVLRAVAGGLAVHVRISPWLLLCAFLLALFLALCKRRHEKGVPEEEGGTHRTALAEYDRALLDHLISITGGATVVAYAMYTLSPATVEKFGTDKLGLTIPFVLYGIFRYLDLVHRKEEGGAPERVLLNDGPLLTSIVLYLVALAAVFVLTRWT